MKTRPTLCSLAILCALPLLSACTQEQAQRFAEGMQQAQEPQLWPAPTYVGPPPMQVYQLPMPAPMPSAPRLVTTNCQMLYGQLSCQSF